MKLTIEKNKLSLNPEQFLRQASYVYIRDRRSGQDSFARRLTRDHYPRFHVYINDFKDKVILDLHLDQKRPGYQGQKRHNAEYDTPVVGKEIERLQELISKLSQRAVEKPVLPEKKKGFFSRIFKS